MAANLFHEVIIDLPVIIVDNSPLCLRVWLFSTMFLMIYSLSRNFRIDADDDKAFNGESIFIGNAVKSQLAFIYSHTWFILLSVFK